MTEEQLEALETLIDLKIEQELAHRLKGERDINIIWSEIEEARRKLIS